MPGAIGGRNLGPPSLTVGAKGGPAPLAVKKRLAAPSIVTDHVSEARMPLPLPPGVQRLNTREGATTVLFRNCRLCAAAILKLPAIDSGLESNKSSASRSTATTAPLARHLSAPHRA